MPLVQSGPIDLLYRNVIRIDAVETAHVNGPDGFFIVVHSRNAERQNAAVRAKVVFGGLGVPLVESHIFQWGNWPEVFNTDSKVQRTSFVANRAVTHPDMIDVSVYFKFDPATVAGSCIGFFHPHLSRFLAYLVIFGTLAQEFHQSEQDL